MSRPKSINSDAAQHIEPTNDETLRQGANQTQSIVEPTCLNGHLIEKSAINYGCASVNCEYFAGTTLPKPKDSEPNPITSCHNVEAVVVGSETMHYECPVCNQSVNFDGSNPKGSELRKELEKIWGNSFVETISGDTPKIPYNFITRLEQLLNKEINKAQENYLDAVLGDGTTIIWKGKTYYLSTESLESKLTELDKRIQARKKPLKELKGYQSGWHHHDGYNQAIDNISKIIKGMM